MRRTLEERERYMENRLRRLELAGHECEARWHPSCPTVSADPSWQMIPHLIAHHVRQRRHGGGDEVGNLLIVCEWCHNRIHSRPAEAERYGFIYAKNPEGGIK